MQATDDEYDIVNGSSADSGSFLTGFTIGLFAGAAGYFLFGTDRGGKVRRELIAEWEAAKDHLVERGVMANPQATLRGLIKDTVEEAVRKVGLMEKKIDRRGKIERTKAKSSGSTVLRTQDKEKSSRKFKGI